jgi:hypothetical protein
MKTLSKGWLFLAFTILFLLVLVGLLPSFINTEWGQKQVAGLINSYIPGKVEIGHMHIQWGKGQRIEGLLLKDPQGKIVASIDKVETEATLLQLISGSPHLGYTQLENLNAVIMTNEDGSTNLQEALIESRPVPLKPQKPSEILLSNVQVKAHLLGQQAPLFVQMTGNTEQGDLMGHFNIEALLKGVTSNSWNELFKQELQDLLTIEGSKNAAIQGTVANFPVDVLDRLLALKKPELDGVFRSSLGEKVNLNLDKSEEGFIFKLSVQSPLVQGDIKAKIAQNQVTLQEPSQIQAVLLPELIALFTDVFQLTQPAPVQVNLESFTIPLAFLEEKEAVHPCNFAFRAQTHLSSTAIDVFPLGPMKLLKLDAHLQTEACDPHIQVQIRGLAQQDQQKPYEIKFDTTLGKPASLRDILPQVANGGVAQIEFIHFPLAGLNQAFPDQAFALNQAGNLLDLSLFARQNQQGHVDLELKFQTDRLTPTSLQFHIDDEVSLVHPVNIDYQIPWNILKDLSGIEQKLPVSPTPLSLTLKTLKFPLNSPQDIKFQFEGAFKEMELLDVGHFPATRIRQLHVSAEANSLKKLNVNVSLQGIPLDSQFHTLLGDEFTVTASSQIILNQKKEWAVSHLQVKAHSSLVDLFIQGAGAFSEFVLTNPLEIHYLVTPEVLKTIKWSTDLACLVQDSAFLHFKVDPFQLDLKDIHLSSLNLKGEMQLDHLALKDEAGYSAVLKGVYIPWKVEASKNLIQLNIRGVTAWNHPSQQKPTDLIGKLIIHNCFKENQLNFERCKIELETEFISIPTSVVNVFLDKRNLVPLIGPALDIGIKALVDRQSQEPGYWDMDVDSEYFHCRARLKLQDAVVLYSPIKARWNLTPEGYQHLKKITNLKQNFILLEPLDISILVSKLSLPLKNQSFLDKGEIDLQMATNEVRLQNSRGVFPVRLDAHLQSSNLTQDILVNGNIISRNGTKTVVEGLLSGLFEATGKKRSLEQIGLNLSLNTDKVPLSFLTALFSLESHYPSLMVLIGDQIRANIQAQLQQLTGPLTVDVQGQKGHFVLDGSLRRGTLLLNKPFEYAVPLTTELSQTLFSQSLPFLSSAIQSEQPILLKIDSKGFSLPLYPFNLQKLKLSQGSLQLGKVLFKNEGDVKETLSFLSPLSEDLITIWFTPIYFQLKKGMLNIDRFDMLVANLYPLACWGNIDLPSNQLDMTLGISGQTLRSAFNIQTMNSQDLLQIPIKGKGGHVKIDRKRALARISALLAQSQGSVEGFILGSVLEIAATEKDPLPPPPTTNPLPWKDLFQTEAEAAPIKEEKKHKKNKEKNKDPLKELEQEASSLLQQLIK